MASTSDEGAPPWSAAIHMNVVAMPARVQGRWNGCCGSSPVGHEDRMRQTSVTVCGHECNSPTPQNECDNDRTRSQRRVSTRQERAGGTRRGSEFVGMAAKMEQQRKVEHPPRAHYARRHPRQTRRRPTMPDVYGGTPDYAYYCRSPIERCVVAWLRGGLVQAERSVDEAVDAAAQHVSPEGRGESGAHPRLEHVEPIV